MRILIFVSVLAILISVAVLISVIIKSNKDGGAGKQGKTDGSDKGAA
jgi:preprotein translocase subunit SecG